MFRKVKLVCAYMDESDDSPFINNKSRGAGYVIGVKS